MAHQHEEALDRALIVVRRFAAAEGGRWRSLAEFLAEVRQDPLDLRRRPAEDMLRAWPPAEQATLFLVALYPRVVLCEIAGQFPVEQQGQLYRVGLQAGEEAFRLAAMLEDPAAAAFVRNVMARGYYELCDLETARAATTRPWASAAR
jgi:hypothetical protein